MEEVYTGNSWDELRRALESMRTGEEKNGTLHRSGGSCSFSEYGTSPGSG